MKEFFKKLWEAIKAFCSSLYKKVVNLLLGIPVPRYVYFIIGLIACAFFAIVIPGAIEWPAFPLAMLALVICFVQVISGKQAKWWNAVAFILGALIIQIFAWI